MGRELVHWDGEIDRLNRAVFIRAVEVGNEPDLREWAMFMILVACCLERITANAVDIAEQTVFVRIGLFREFTAPAEQATRLRSPVGGLFMTARRVPRERTRRGSKVATARRRSSSDGSGERTCGRHPDRGNGRDVRAGLAVGALSRRGNGRHSVSPHLRAPERRPATGASATHNHGRAGALSVRSRFRAPAVPTCAINPRSRVEITEGAGRSAQIGTQVQWTLGTVPRSGLRVLTAVRS